MLLSYVSMNLTMWWIGSDVSGSEALTSNDLRMRKILRPTTVWKTSLPRILSRATAPSRCDPNASAF